MEKYQNIRHVAVLGINHRTSDCELRERLLINEPELESALHYLRSMEGIEEALILSTCNRVELYVAGANIIAMYDTLTEFLVSYHKVKLSTFEDHIYFYHCRKAVEHLFKVVSSLDSMVIGESQILHQVKKAYRHACRQETAGLVLNKLFHSAMRVGKRVRNETEINEGSLSVASVAIDFAKNRLSHLNTSTAMVIGAGEMARLTARHLHASGLSTIYFANRTVKNAQKMADDFGGKAIPLTEINTVLADCDIVISSTGAQEQIIKQADLKSAMIKRNHYPVILIDIAAPRDIEPKCGALKNVDLFGIDEISQVIQNTINSRSGKIASALDIIEQEVSGFCDWYNTRKVVPAIIHLRESFESIRDKELERYKNQFSAIPESSRQSIFRFAETLTEKLLYVPSSILKENSKRQQ
ncbi:glutamyl-tRNA reductase [Chitinispirillales bacterium ANBcel5]|uniref:glutamyl-tRNA reductase n=1 Tax=Cellulosispirillum alkaliphilum TaxID=3039283 RepID=UPI002A4F9394|nr:glutamyl-tRNA reductase [Chitinispirillales bacterium ANBcel5]